MKIFIIRARPGFTTVMWTGLKWSSDYYDAKLFSDPINASIECDTLRKSSGFSVTYGSGPSVWTLRGVFDFT